MMDVSDIKAIALGAMILLVVVVSKFENKEDQSHLIRADQGVWYAQLG
ncbi:hypothetical protein [Ruegeria sp. ANG-S4]|nr:hypothetical protein [Ruegeria sp. ANG-S4]